MQRLNLHLSARYVHIDKHLTLNKTFGMRMSNRTLILWPDMKAAAALFLFMFFTILFGSETASAAGHDTLRSYSPAMHMDKQEQSGNLKMRLASLPVKSNHLSEKKESLTIDFDDDDEQEDFIFAGKYIVPLAYFITLASLSVLTALYATVKNRLPFCAHFSETSSRKYILQRVLRI
jgi:hypothetical protein